MVPAEKTEGVRYGKLITLFNHGRYEAVVAATLPASETQDAPLTLLGARAMLRIESNPDRIALAIAAVRNLTLTGKHRAEALLICGIAKMSEPDLLTARHYMEAARLLTHNLDLLAEIGYNLAKCDHGEGKYDPTVVESYGAFKSKNNLHLGRAYLMRAYMHHGLHRNADFLHLLQRALKCFDQVAEIDIIWKMTVALNLICTGMEVGDREAVGVGEVAMGQINWSHPGTSLAPMRYLAARGLAWFRLLCGEPEEALSLFRRSIEIAPTPAYRLLSIADRALIAQTERSNLWVRDCLNEAASQMREINWDATSGEECLALLSLARIVGITQPKEARKHLELFWAIQSKQEKAQGSHTPRILAMANMSLASVLTGLDETEMALPYLTSAEKTLYELGFKWRLCEALEIRGRITKDPNTFTHAQKIIDEIYPLSWVARDIRGQLAQQHLSAITPAERRVLAQIYNFREWSNTETAVALHIATKTLAIHLNSLGKKFGVVGRKAIVKWCEAQRLNP